MSTSVTSWQLPARPPPFSFSPCSYGRLQLPSLTDCGPNFLNPDSLKWFLLIPLLKYVRKFVNKDSLLRIKRKSAIPTAVVEKLFPLWRGYNVALRISRRNSDGDVKVSSTIISDVSFVVGLLTCEPSVFIRAAEDLLSQIQRNYQKPQEELKVLREAASGLLSKHDSELQAATGLVREAEAKTREGSHLLRIVKANLREVSVSPNSSLLRQSGEPDSLRWIRPFWASWKMSPKYWLQHVVSGTSLRKPTCFYEASLKVIFATG